MNLAKATWTERIREFHCPLITFWLPWYWQNSDVTLVRKAAARFTWRTTEDVRGKIILVAKTIIWPFAGLFGLILEWKLNAGDAQRITGKNRLTQLRELVYFTCSLGHGATHYYLYRLYFDDILAHGSAFISERELHLLNSAVNCGKDTEIVNNKRRFADSCRSLKIPHIPTISAFYLGQPAAADFQLPKTSLYFKPVDGSQGEGIECWEFDTTTGEWKFSELSLDENALVQHFINASKKASYILQEAALNHHSLQAQSPHGLMTFRLISIFGALEEPEVIYGQINTPAKGAAANHGSNGGTVVTIDINTGKMEAAIRRLPLIQRFSQDPETGEQIEGQICKAWPKLKQLATEAHKNYPEVFAFGWDLVFTSRGAEVLEGNTQWGLPPHLFLGKNSFTSSYTALLKRGNSEGSYFGSLLSSAPSKGSSYPPKNDLPSLPPK